MTVYILLIIGLSLSIFSTSMLLNVENCLSEKENFRSILILSVGQGLMLLLGYGIGSLMAPLLSDNQQLYSLLIFILVGGKIVFESFRIKYKFKVFQLKSWRDLTLLALGKGFHAMFVGLALIAVVYPIKTLTTLLVGSSIIFSLLGIQAGKKWGRFSLANLAELLGGVLILIAAILFMVNEY